MIYWIMKVIHNHLLSTYCVVVVVGPVTYYVVVYVCVVGPVVYPVAYLYPDPLVTYLYPPVTY